MTSTGQLLLKIKHLKVSNTKKKIIDFHVESYRNPIIGGSLKHISAAHNVSKEQFDDYQIYRDYCIRAGITFVDEKTWDEAFPDKIRIQYKEEIPQ